MDKVANDKLFMDRCYQLAKVAATEGESPVGSVVVLLGKIVGEGSERSKQLHDVTRHAEVVAILDALTRVDNLQGATLYSNVEPCILCSFVIRHHKISRVVFAEKAGELGGTAEPFNVLTTSHIQKWGGPPDVVAGQEHA